MKLSIILVSLIMMVIIITWIFMFMAIRFEPFNHGFRLCDTRHFLVLQSLTPQKCCAHGRYLKLLDWICCHRIFSCQICILNQNILQGNSMLCYRLSLGCLVVPWINHLPHVCWASFWKDSLKQHLVCNPDVEENAFTYIRIYIS